jgi:hypothetical protein
MHRSNASPSSPNSCSRSSTAFCPVEISVRPTTTDGKSSETFTNVSRAGGICEDESTSRQLTPVSGSTSYFKPPGIHGLEDSKPSRRHIGSSSAPTLYATSWQTCQASSNRRQSEPDGLPHSRKTTSRYPIPAPIVLMTTKYLARRILRAGNSSVISTKRNMSQR